MVQLELPHLNVLTKCDLADRAEVERFLDTENAAMISMHGRDEDRGLPPASQSIFAAKGGAGQATDQQSLIGGTRENEFIEEEEEGEEGEQV
ncbi:unnamed protein product, partial [Choristocarpus tenellus]